MIFQGLHITVLFSKVKPKLNKHNLQFEIDPTLPIHTYRLISDKTTHPPYFNLPLPWSCSLPPLPVPHLERFIKAAVCPYLSGVEWGSGSETEANGVVVSVLSRSSFSRKSWKARIQKLSGNMIMIFYLWKKKKPSSFNQFPSSKKYCWYKL